MTLTETDFMTKRFWIKLYLDILDDTKLGTLHEYNKWRAIELFLVAGENGNDGLLPPVESMAWRLRLPPEKLAETLVALAQAGVVHETPKGWVVSDFSKTQVALTSTERSQYSRRRKKDAAKGCRNGNDFATAQEEDSTSTSTSDSISDSFSESMEVDESRVLATTGGEDRSPPATPSEAAQDPDITIFTVVTGRLPGVQQYPLVIDTLRFIREKLKMTDEMVIPYLSPYWLAWASRKRQDGRYYDPSNLTWLTEWAVNGQVPMQNASPADGNPQSSRNADVIRQVAARRK
jgi:hypothetical protein